MKVSIQNLGRVKKASLDLSKKLTILTGQNNSGKTWISYLVYGVGRDFQNGFNLFDSDRIAEQLILKEKISIDLEEHIFSRKEEINAQISKRIEHNLPSIFKADRNLFADTTVEVNLVDEHLFERIKGFQVNAPLQYWKDFSIFFEKSPGKESLSITLLKIAGDESSMKGISPKNIKFLSNGFFESVSTALLWNTLGRAYMMPAERIAINIFSKEMSLKRNKAFDEIQNLFITQDQETETIPELLGRKASRYAKPIHDALLIAEDLSELQTYQSEFAWLAKELEKEILKGKISVNEEGVFEFKPRSRNSKKLGIHLTGSVVKTFASLIFYFRHIAEKGDFLIIDEPEINLHPDNQVLLARILAKIANSGVKLMISTHSEYILKELNFFLIMNQDKNIFHEMSEKYGYSEDVLLSHKDMNVFLLKESGSFKKISVKQDGFDVETIDKVINQQSQKSFDITGW